MTAAKAMTLTFSKPSRQTDLLTQEPYYEFPVMPTGPLSEYTFQCDLTAAITVPDDIVTSLLEIFVHDTASSFAKAPSPEHHRKHLEHIMDDKMTYPPEFTYTLALASVRVFAKKTQFVWKSIAYERKVDDQIPSDFLDEENTTDMKKIVVSSEQVLEPVTDIPLQDDDGSNPFRLDDGEGDGANSSVERLYRLRLLEAKVTAKLAKYRAKKAADKYYSRFGHLPRPNPDDMSQNGDSQENSEEESNGDGVSNNS